jgi:hypothetical protein
MSKNRRSFLTESLRTIGGAAFLWSQRNRALANGYELDFSPYLIVIHCDGGWDPTLVFENKLKASHIDIQGGLTLAKGGGKIPYMKHPDRPAVDDFFAQHGSKACIINGVYCGSIGHEAALRHSTGSYLPKTTNFVDWGSFYGAQVGMEATFPHVLIGAPYMPGVYGKFTTNLSPKLLEEYSDKANCPASQYLATGDKVEKALDSYVGSSYQAFMENRLNPGPDSDKILGLINGYPSESTLCRFVAKQDFPAGESTFQSQCRLAARMIGAGHAYSLGLQAGAFGLWDSHTDNFSVQSENFQMLFAGINTLIEEATTQGFVDKLTIVVKSELGRSPRLNSTAKKG